MGHKHYRIAGAEDEYDDVYDLDEINDDWGGMDTHAVLTDQGTLIAHFFGEPNTDRATSNAKFAAVVFNFCAGIPTDQLEGVTLKEVVGALRGLMDALAMGPLEMAAKYGPDAHPDEAVMDAAIPAQAILSRFPPRSSTVEPEDG